MKGTTQAGRSPAATGKTDYVLGFAFAAKRTRVLLVMKQSPAWQRGKFNGVGGKVEPEEYVTEAMSREFREETGLHVRRELWGTVAELIGPDYRVSVLAADLEAEHPPYKPTELVGWYGCDGVAALPVVANLPVLLLAARRGAYDLTGDGDFRVLRLEEVPPRELHAQRDLAGAEPRYDYQAAGVDGKTVKP